ncbi:hypothetical protein CBS101457_000109 [Exobasidium rhododendri]|nr:hypothetical protein CBS101457_000109 [Exobasidium rhododendri]
MAGSRSARPSRSRAAHGDGGLNSIFETPAYPPQGFQALLTEEEPEAYQHHNFNVGQHQTFHGYNYDMPSDDFSALSMNNIPEYGSMNTIPEYGFDQSQYGGQHSHWQGGGSSSHASGYANYYDTSSSSSAYPVHQSFDESQIRAVNDSFHTNYPPQNVQEWTTPAAHPDYQHHGSSSSTAAAAASDPYFHSYDHRLESFGREHLAAVSGLVDLTNEPDSPDVVEIVDPEDMLASYSHQVDIHNPPVYTSSARNKKKNEATEQYMRLEESLKNVSYYDLLDVPITDLGYTWTREQQNQPCWHLLHRTHKRAIISIINRETSLQWETINGRINNTINPIQALAILSANKSLIHAAIKILFPKSSNGVLIFPWTQLLTEPEQKQLLERLSMVSNQNIEFIRYYLARQGKISSEEAFQLLHVASHHTLVDWVISKGIYQKPIQRRMGTTLRASRDG